MTDFFLISCTKSKRAHPCAARDLYMASDWFAKARGYVEALGAPWAILSAEHGLVDPDTVLAPYETSLVSMYRPARLAWASKVIGQLAAIDWNRVEGTDAVRFVFLAGDRYREFLEPTLADGFQVAVPMRGLMMGEQKSWLRRETAALREPV